jgi:hypothetical protein
MFLLEILKNWGIDIFDSSTPPLVGFALCILILSVLSVLCFINIVFYFVVLLIIDSKFVTDKINKNGAIWAGWGKIITKIINFYKQTRPILIVIEILIFIWINQIIIYSCYRLVSAYYFKS